MCLFLRLAGAYLALDVFDMKENKTKLKHLGIFDHKVSYYLS